MKLGLIGYGKTGKMVAEAAQKRGHEIVSIIDLNRPDTFSTDVDCYIDFSTAEAVHKNIIACCNIGVPIVIGTTGWLNDLSKFEQIFIKTGNKGIWSGNFSVGVNLFWQIIAEAAAKFSKFSTDYDVSVHEIHHKNKIDSPSGTAIQTADVILKNFSSKNSLVTETLQRKIKPNELHVSSARYGEVVGTHTTVFDSLFDSIEITHTAKTREGFALGAVLAAEMMPELSPGFYKFSNIFEQLYK